MSKRMLPRLAAQNIKKNGKYYLPYILTSTLSVAMFYIIYALASSKSLGAIYGGAQLRSLLNMSMFIAALFFSVFQFYTHSFLTKRRKKEYGLYSVLGMEKKHICLLSLFESIYTALISIICGLATGVLFSKLAFLLLLKILHLTTPLQFEINSEVLLITALFFVLVFTVIYLNSIRVIGKSSAIELLHGENTGEKEPKSKWIISLLGVLTLSGGYFIAVTTTEPLQAIGIFIIAAILVMIGTYLLFTSGSITLLKLLRKNKNYYYKTKHFSSVSGMIYRMKQNAIGLSSICIFCTAVLVMVSTTASLYGGMADLIRTRYPRNIVVSLNGVDDKAIDNIEDVVAETAEKYGASVDNKIAQRFNHITLLMDNGTFVSTPNGNYSSSDIANFYLITLDNYNRNSGSNAKLAGNEVLLQTVYGNIDTDTLHFGDSDYMIKGTIDNIEAASSERAKIVKSYFLVVADQDAIEAIFKAVGSSDYVSGISSYNCSFDTSADAETQIKLYKDIHEKLKDVGNGGTIEGAEDSKESFYSLYGGLLFIGIFLGVLFMLATVLIIYYKQVSEGYDDRKRFEIMQKVGMSNDEIKKTISSQILTMFFLPLVASFVHLAFAFPIITRLMAILNLTNIWIFVVGLLITAAVFSLVYAAVYALTAKVYYKIVI